MNVGEKIHVVFNRSENLKDMDNVIDRVECSKFRINYVEKYFPFQLFIKVRIQSRFSGFVLGS